jgi:hypothetical protein
MRELAASIAHEVNQPLTGIVSNGGACLRWLGADGPIPAPDAEEVREAVRDMVTIDDSDPGIGSLALGAGSYLLAVKWAKSYVPPARCRPEGVCTSPAERPRGDGHIGKR